MNISDEAVEVVARWLWERDSHDIVEGPRPSWDDLATSGIVWKSGLTDTRQEARELLEAAAPILLSHEREEARLAHIDAVVNAQTADRLEAELEQARIEAWEQGRVDGYHHRPNPYKETGE